MNTLEEYIQLCAAKMGRNEDVTADLAQALSQFPYAAALYFMRGSEAAELQNFTDAMHDFATALVLEPEFHLARLQYILYCFKTEQFALVPVLLQPLLLAGGTYTMIGDLLATLFSEPVTAFDQKLAELQTQPDMLPAVWENLLSLRQYLPSDDAETAAQTEASPTATSGEISSILLEIYQQKH